MIKVSIKGTQAIEAALKKALKKYRDTPFATIGIHQEAGRHPDSDLSNAQIGALLNYGTPGPPVIPPRPWLIPGFLQSETKVSRDFQVSIEKGDDPDTALERSANIIVGSVKEFMTDLMVPENSKFTVAKKGFDNPLIETGELRASVNYKMTNTVPEEGLT